MMRNIARQPKASVSIVSSGGAIAEPHFEPESQMPAAWPRSSRGNHWVAILLEFGEVGDSPMPSRKRKVRNCAMLWPKAIRRSEERRVGKEWRSRGWQYDGERKREVTKWVRCRT